MIPEVSNPFDVESERAYAVFDTSSGAIIHLHRVTTFKGGTALSREEEEARALEMAKQFGHSIEGVRVLSVEPRDLDKHLRQRVDVKTLQLVADPVAEEPTSRGKPSMLSD